MHQVVEQLKSEGYAIIRGFLSPAEIAAVSAETDRIYAEGLKHHATYRDREPAVRGAQRPQGQAPRRAAGALDRLDQPSDGARCGEAANYYAVLEPFLGRGHQADHVIRSTGSRRAQNTRLIDFIRTRVFVKATSRTFDYLRSTVTTGLAIDRQTAENGALRIIPRKPATGLSRAVRRWAHHGRARPRTRSCAAPGSIRQTS